MFNQRGAAPAFLLPIISVLILGFNMATNASKSIFPPATPAPIASATTQTPKPSTTTHQIAGQSYDVSNSDQQLTLSGNYVMAGTYKLSYNFTLPKNGGPISGSTTGSCNTTFTGNQMAPDNNEDATFSGIETGTCQPIPGLGFKTAVKANIQGTVHYKTGKIEVTYDLTEPYQTNGSVEIPFNQ